jgi:single stranded DNA-binding protein
MASVAKITLVGRLGKDAEAMESKNGGKPYARLSVATETYDGKDSEGKGKYATQWWSCVVFGNRADYVIQHAKKGQDVYISGNMTITSKDGKTFANVQVDDVVIISRPTNGASSGDAEASSEQAAPAQKAAAPAASRQTQRPAPVAASVSKQAIDDLTDDDIPF